MYTDHAPIPVESGGILPCRFKTIRFIDASDVLNALKDRSLREEAKEVEDWIDRHRVGQPNLSLLRMHADTHLSASTLRTVEQLIGTAYIYVDWI